MERMACDPNFPNSKMHPPQHLRSRFRNVWIVDHPHCVVAGIGIVYRCDFNLAPHTNPRADQVCKTAEAQCAIQTWSACLGLRVAQLATSYISSSIVAPCKIVIELAMSDGIEVTNLPPTRTPSLRTGRKT